MELSRLDAITALALIRSSTISVTEYAQILLNRIEERDPIIHAWAYLDRDTVLRQAAALDNLPQHERGPLHGLPIGIKDVILTKDQPTHYHSPIYANEGCSNVDAACVKILRSAGALIMGKTETTEFAASAVGGPCVNPHDIHRTPGGSSSGSAAAVADFQVPVAIGTQTGGSTIRPASYSGVFGFKPTWGVISREGAKPFAVSCDTIGLFSRNVQDLRLIARVLRLEDDHPVSHEPFPICGAKFAFCQGPNWSKAGPGTIKAMQRARQLLTSAGAVVEDLQLPPAFGSASDWCLQITQGEGRASFIPEYCMDKSQLDPTIREHVERPVTELSRKDLLAAQDGLASLRPQLDSFASAYSAIITPSAVDEAEFGLGYTGSAVFNAMWTILHVPAINIPGLKGNAGLPVGISLIAARHHDLHLLHVAEAVAEVFAQAGEA